MPKISFQMIGDSRFNKEPLLEVLQLADNVHEVLSNELIDYSKSDVHQINWDGFVQYRIDFTITKTSKFTYNQLYKLINSVKPVPYSIIRDKVIKI